MSLPACLKPEIIFRRASSRLLAAFILAVLFVLYNLYFRKFGAFSEEFALFDTGGFLLAGIPYRDMTFNMPLFGLVVAAASHLGIGPRLLFAIIHMGVYALVFSAGCLLGGWRAAFVSLIAAGLFGTAGGMVYEQAFYSFLLLLVLNCLLLKLRRNTLRNSALFGLSIGASLLVRSPLFLFPPFIVLAEWLLHRAEGRAFLLRSLVFLAASYVLLLPWGRLNRTVTGEFALFDGGRARDNIVTSAMGSIFTISGDSYKAAGLGESEDAYKFYFTRALKGPVFFVEVTAKRLWHIFLFYPVLFLLWFAAAVRGRDKDKLLVFCFPAYFILIHSVLSVEVRYIYPVLYLLPPLIAGALLPRAPGPDAEPELPARRIITAAFCAASVLVILTEGLLLAYPHRAAATVLAEDTFTRASARFPRDRVFRGLKCREAWRAGDDAVYRACLTGLSRGSGHKTVAYYLAVTASTSPAAVPSPAGDESQRYVLECRIARMLREFELGRNDAAMISYREARALFARNYNRLHGNRQRGAKEHGYRRDAAPYEADRQLAARIAEDRGGFWNDVTEVITLWPLDAMSRILKGMKGEAAPAGSLADLAGLIGREGGKTAARGRVAAVFSFHKWLLPDLAGNGPPGFYRFCFDGQQ